MPAMARTRDPAEVQKFFGKVENEITCD